ncbi:MAG: secondary thiamine-phosphate synthase enzyme YjbQ [Promethearchaeia archaeon]
MIVFNKIRVKTSKRETLVDITSQIQELIDEANVIEGICRIFVPHTTAAITINENADPSVKKDIISHLKEVVPKKSSFAHREGNSDAHIKSTLTGPSLFVLIHEGKLVLGTWQGIMFTEYDGPRSRNVYIQIQGE